MSSLRPLFLALSWGFFASCSSSNPPVNSPADARTSTDASAGDAPDANDPRMFLGQRIDGYDRAMPDVDAIGYDLDITVDDSKSERETYRAELTGAFVATRALDALTLDFVGNDLDAVEVDGAPARASRDAATLTIPLGRSVPVGEAFRVKVRYHGALFQGTGVNPNNFNAYGGLMVLQRNRAGRKMYVSLDWPSKARRWMPVRDHPRDGVIVGVRATFPAQYTVIANGRLEQRTDNANGTRTWRYVSRTPMPAYDLHLAAYDDWTPSEPVRAMSGAEVQWYPYSNHVEAGQTMFGDLVPVMDFYERSFGPFRWERAAFLEEPIFGGGMEHATVVSMDETLFNSPTRNRQTAFHELGHHWSGNLVRIATWNDFWLSEGFTDYLAARAVTAHDGADAGRGVWRAFMLSALNVSGTVHHPVRPPDPEVDVLTIFDSISYRKGAWTLRMLEQQVGTQPFTDFLRGWFERRRGTAVTTRDLEDDLDGAFPDRGMRAFFAQRVYRDHHPELRVTRRYDASAGMAEVTVEQVQTRGVSEGFTFPLEVMFIAGDRTHRATIDVSGRATTARVAVPFDPSDLVIDPDEKLFLAVTCTAGSGCRAGYSCQTTLNPPVCVPLL